MEKYFTAGQAVHGDMEHAHCMLDTYGYRHTHSEYVILIAFPLHEWYHECYVICTLIVLYSHESEGFAKYKTTTRLYLMCLDRNFLHKPNFNRSRVSAMNILS